MDDEQRFLAGQKVGRVGRSLTPACVRFEPPDGSISACAMMQSVAPTCFGCPGALRPTPCQTLHRLRTGYPQLHVRRASRASIPSRLFHSKAVARPRHEQGLHSQVGARTGDSAHALHPRTVDHVRRDASHHRRRHRDDLPAPMVDETEARNEGIQATHAARRTDEVKLAQHKYAMHEPSTKVSTARKSRAATGRKTRSQPSNDTAGFWQLIPSLT